MERARVIALIERHVVLTSGDMIYCCECKAFAINGDLHHDSRCEVVAVVKHDPDHAEESEPRARASS